MKKLTKKCIAITMAMLVLPANRAFSMENGTSTYPAGALTIYNGIMPEPGTYINMFNQYLHQNKVVDNDGKKIFDAAISGTGHAIQIVHVFDDLSVAGAHVAAEIDQTYVNVQFKSKEIGIDTSEGALGDTTLGFRLGWHNKTVHQQFNVKATVPTGSNDRDEVLNAGVNYYSALIHYSVTWFPTPNIEASGEAVGIWNAPNKNTNYRSGNSINLNYGLNYHFNNGWFAGAGGAWINQIDDDTQNGKSVNGNGNRMRTFAIGPQAGYVAPGWGAYLAWQHQAYVRNSAEGDLVWLNFSYKL